MLGANISTLIFISLRDGSILFYFKYIVGNQSVSFLGTEYDLSSTVLSSIYMSIWLATNMIGVLLAKPLAARLERKYVYHFSADLRCIQFHLFFVEPDQIYAIYFLNILLGISSGIVLPLGWSMYADIADYSEWKTGRRATGLVFSSSSMSQKFGWTLGGAIAGWVLAAFNFVPNAVQSDETLLGIRLMISVLAGIGALMAFGFISFYQLDETYMKKIVIELETRRAA